MKNLNQVVKNVVCRLLVFVFLVLAVLNPTPAKAAVRLNTNDISNFMQIGNQPPALGPNAITFSDADVADSCGLFANEPDAAPGTTLDLTVAFQVRSVTPNGPDGGFMVAINDGQTKSAIAVCAVINGLRVIALRGQGVPDDPQTYPVYVTHDWLSQTTTLKLRRWADGSAEILKLNEAPPNPRLFLRTDQVAGRTRPGVTVDFGCIGGESLCTADVTQFYTEKPSPPQAIVPVNGLTPTLTPVTINNLAGDQYDPHISGDWVSYTSDLSIRYYNFATNTDAAIPLGASARDLLSDISGSKLVFSRVITAVKTAVMVFDTATPAVAPIEIDSDVGTTRIGSAIGGNTVAYMDYGLEGHGELVIHDLTSNTSRRITNDAANDQNPAVSPDGNVVTWEHSATSTSNNDIWQAVRNSSFWQVSVASDTDTLNPQTNTFNPEANPDTNGTLVVYDSLRNSNGDIFWRPVAGGPEVQLQLPGFEANPNLASNLIAFESRPTIFDTTDIYVYDITTNHLYKITNTPLVTEQLNDLTVLSDGRVRVVWTSDEDGFDQRNIKGATFSRPPVTPSINELLQQLIDLVESFNLRHGIANSLKVKLVNALAAVQSGNTTSACGKLDAFINEVQAQSGHAITPQQAAQLINLANLVRAGLSCP